MATPNTASTSNGSLSDCQSPFVIKLVLLGQDAAGKSSLVLRFVKDKFYPMLDATIGAAFLTAVINVDNRTVKFLMWDTAGQGRYKSLAPMYYKGADAVIVIYDITSMESFNTAKSWVKELQSQASPNIVIALSGDKADLAYKRNVQFQEAQVYAEENNLLFMETSALTAQNVTEIFVAVARKKLQATYDENGWIPLMVASRIGHLEAVMTLIGSGTEVNHTDKDGWSSLMIASEKGHYEVVKTLIGAGAEVSLNNKNGWSPLMVASQNGHLEAVMALIGSGTEVNHTDKDIKKALHVAEKNGHKNVVELLEACKTKIFRQQFHNMYEKKEQQIRQQKKETEKQLQDVRQQKEETERHIRDVRQQKDETERQIRDVRQQKEQTEKQLRDVRQQKERTEKQFRDVSQGKEETEKQLDDVKKKTEKLFLLLRDNQTKSEQQLHEMWQQKEQAEQKLHDMRQQKEQAEQQFHEMWQQKGEMKEQIEAYEKRLKATESMLVTMQLKNKSLEQELLQQSDTSQITQTANFIYYSLLNSSVSGNSSADEAEHP